MKRTKRKQKLNWHLLQVRNKPSFSARQSFTKKTFFSLRYYTYYTLDTLLSFSHMSPHKLEIVE